MSVVPIPKGNVPLQIINMNKVYIYVLNMIAMRINDYSEYTNKSYV